MQNSNLWLCVDDNNVNLVLPQCKFVIFYKKRIPILLSVFDLVFCNNFLVFVCVQNDTGMPVKWETKQIYVAIKLIKPLG